MQPSPDVIIVGLGAMGSSALLHLARRGITALGIDRFTPPHDRGSSHGLSRLIRLCYAEHPDYVPLLRRAYQLWDQLQQEARQPLMRLTGGLYLGAPSDEFVAGALAAAKEHSLEHEMLDAAAIRSRFPQFTLPDHFVGFYEPTTGVLFPERIISSQIDLASRLGARTLTGTQVLSWSATPSGVTVTTDSSELHAAKLILAAGPWMPQLAGTLPCNLRVTRQVMAWFQPRDPSRLFTPDFPSWAIGHGDGTGGVHYGMPMFPTRRPSDIPLGGPGIKVALHKPADAANPDTLDRTERPAEIADLARFLRTHIPAAAGDLIHHRACMYTNSPDQHFVIDHHPQHDNVLLLSPCSGHGFKFASVIGEAAADLIATGATTLPITFLSLNRFKSEH